MSILDRVEDFAIWTMMISVILASLMVILCGSAYLYDREVSKPIGTTFDLGTSMRDAKPPAMQITSGTQYCGGFTDARVGGKVRVVCEPRQ